MNKKNESTEQLKCFLTDKEKLDMGKSLAETLAKKSGFERELNSLKKQFGSKIEMCDSQIASLQELINVGYEFRSVKIEILFDFDKGVVETTRIDTFEVIEIRPMTANERQMMIDFNVDVAEEFEKEAVEEESEEAIEETK